VRPLNVFQIGNFEPPHSTENHLRQALEHLGHTVFPFNERPEHWKGANYALSHLIAEGNRPDFVLWTSTSDYAPAETFPDQHTLLVYAASQHIPTVSYHLDLWFGLKREHEVREKPFFRTDIICTADGGHQDDWWRLGMQHYWFPPAIVESEVFVGTPRDRYAADICFVGSWHKYGHRESRHRFELLAHLKDIWGAQVRFWPEPGQPRIDGRELADLYASTKVVVGDSCLVPRLQRYWSDRIPNVTGRGAYLLHPDVVGLLDQHPFLNVWDAGDWFMLDTAIEAALADDEWRISVARDCMADTLENHTYEVRCKQLVTLLTQKGML
jgi:hypothetical protein